MCFLSHVIEELKMIEERNVTLWFWWNNVCPFPNQRSTEVEPQSHGLAVLSVVDET